MKSQESLTHIHLQNLKYPWEWGKQTFPLLEFLQMKDIPPNFQIKQNYQSTFHIV